MQGLRRSPLAIFVLTLAWLLASLAPAAAVEDPRVARVEQSMAGAVIQDVSVETYGVTKPAVVRQYLSLKAGDRLEQSGVDRDYANLKTLAGTIPLLTVEPGAEPNTVTLHWIVMDKWFALTEHPFYGDTPLSAAIQGVGFTVTAAPVDSRGSNFSAISQLSQRANLVRLFYTQPLHIDAVKGRESDLVFDTFGGRSVFRESQPEAINIYSWNTGAEATYYVHGTNNNQLQLGVRTTRTTAGQSTGITSPSLYQTSQHPGQYTVLEGGYSHNCGVAPTQWQPPFCSYQYRFQVADAIGVLGTTSEYQSYIADIAKYFSVGKSTVALHVVEARTGGVIPDSFLVCGNGLRAYPKPFCGTDAQNFQAEYRIAQAVPGPLHFVLFTETSASRVRGGTQAFAPPTFQWDPDSGFGFIYRLLRLDFAWGNQGGRFSVEIQGQTF